MRRGANIKQEGTLMKLKLSFIWMSIVTLFFAMPSLADQIKAEHEIVLDQPTLEILPFIRFTCETRLLDEIGRRVPVTVGYTSTAQGILIYKWLRDYYPESAETPLEICNRVSAIFDVLRQEDVIRTISIGTDENSIPSVCAGATCNRPIFNLLPDESPEEVIDDLYLALTTVPVEYREENPSRIQPNESINTNNEGRIFIRFNTFNRIFNFPEGNDRRILFFDETRSGGSR